MSRSSLELSEKLAMSLPNKHREGTLLLEIRQSCTRIVRYICLLLTDIISLMVVLTASLQLRINILPVIFPFFPTSSPPEFNNNIWWMLIIIIVAFAYEGLYTRRLTFWRESKKVVIGLTLAFLIIMASVSLGKLGGEVSRTVLVLSYFLSFFVFPLNKYICKMLLLKVGIWNEPVLVLGTGQTAKAVGEAMARDPYSGYQTVGFLGDNLTAKENIEINTRKHPVMGTFDDVSQLIKDLEINHVVIAAPDLPGSELVSLTNKIQPLVRSVLVVPDLVGMPVMSGETEYFFDQQIMAFRTRNNLASRLNLVIKRIFDLVVGSIILLLLLPVLVLIALLIRLESPGSIVFAHQRIGQGGRQFQCYKFRSMVINAEEVLGDLLAHNPVLQEEWNKDFKLKDDPRVSRVGKILRKTSLDELPQIFNVIKGEMSLVGPRPIVEEELERFGDYARDYLLVLPGMTGLWQVSGRSEIDYADRVRMESWYVRNWSFWLDISLLFRTLGVVLGRKGAY